MTISLASLLLTIGCALASAADKPKAGPPEIPVVRTFGDLMDRPPIDVGGGMRVRLGAESLTSPAGGGVLLYCLTDGTALKRVASFDQLGPLKIVVGEPSEKERLVVVSDVAKVLTQKYPELDKDATVLFVRGVVTPKAGEYEVKFQRPSGVSVASVKITATDDPYPAWMPWRASGLGADERARRGDTEFVANPSTGAAVPAWSGVQPIVVAGFNDRTVVKREPAEPLPTMTPAEPDPEFSVKLDGTTLKLAHPKSMVRSPAGNLLTRWWINGKPYIPLHHDLTPRQQGGQVRMVEDYAIDLEFDPVRIGARAGDKVELQLMYCEHGWEPVEGRKMNRPLALRRAASGWPVMVSNRVEFLAK